MPVADRSPAAPKILRRVQSYTLRTLSGKPCAYLPRNAQWSDMTSRDRTLAGPVRRIGAAGLALLCGFLVSGCVPLISGARAALKPLAMVEALDVTTGSLTGGESVTITGSSLSDITKVTFDGRAATELTARTNSTVTVTVPHAIDYTPGPVEVDVYASGGVNRVGTLVYTYEIRTAVDRQMNYAFSHWKEYNLAQYGDFNDRGGDCMNFVSQTLVARGWTMNEGWYNTAGTDWASPFIYVPDFDTWLVAHPEFGAVRLGLEDLDQVKIGDIVLMDWERNGFFNHAQIVSGVEVIDGQTRVLMIGHNLDSMYRDLVPTLREQSPAGVAYIWSLPAG